MAATAPQGAFAMAQALYLHPEQRAVQELADQLEAAKMGVVAHFYMDPEARHVSFAANVRISACCSGSLPHCWFLLVANAFPHAHRCKVS